MSEHYEQPEDIKKLDSTRLPDSFFVPIVDKVEDFFDHDVISTIEEYIEKPNNFSVVEEILILNKIDQARHFLNVGCELNNDVGNFVETFESLNRDESFEFNSELGKEYAVFLSRFRISGKEIVKIHIPENDEIDVGNRHSALTQHGRLFDNKNNPSTYANRKYKRLIEWFDQDLEHEYPYAINLSIPISPKLQEELQYIVGSEDFGPFFSYLMQSQNQDHHSIKELPISLFVIWLANEKPESFQAHKETVQNYSGDKIQLVTAFLATEFGDDFGDIILDIAESQDSKEVSQLVAAIDAVRKSATLIGAHFDSDDHLDQQLAHMIPTAFIKRTTELIAKAKKDDCESVMPSLMAIQQATAAIANALSEQQFSVLNATHQYGTFRSNGDNPITITARPYGHNARIGFTTKIGKERLNVRLDYEDGTLSLDIGSTASESVNVSEISRRVGSDLAEGELALATLRAERQIQESGYDRQILQLNGNHVREAFADLSVLEPSEFSAIVNRFMYRLALEPVATELEKVA